MIYLKIENNRPTEAPLNFQAETGLILNFNKSPETMVQYGFLPCDENDYFDYKIGKKLIVDNAFVDNPNWATEQAQKEQERIAMLHLTRGDVFRGLLQAKGVTRTQLRAMIEDMPDGLDKEMALIDFDEALEFYRGVALVDTIGLALGITSNQMTKFFETNDFKELTREEIV